MRPLTSSLPLLRSCRLSTATPPFSSPFAQTTLLASARRPMATSVDDRRPTRPTRTSQIIDDGNVSQSDAPITEDASERALPIFKYCGNWGVPKTPGLRHLKMPYSPWLFNGKPIKALTIACRKNGGRSSQTGRIIRRHIGGGFKRRHRKIDFMRLEPGVQDVIRIEFDPGRSAHIALLRSRTGLGADGGWSYIVAPDGMRAGDEVASYRTGVPEGLVPKWDEELNEMSKLKIYGGKNGKKLIPAMPISRPAQVENIRGIDDAWSKEKRARWVEKGARALERKALEKERMLEGRIDERYREVIEEEVRSAVRAAEEATRVRVELEQARLGREEGDLSQKMADTFISGPSSSSSTSQPSPRQFSTSSSSQSEMLSPLPPRPSSQLAPIDHIIPTGITPRYQSHNNPQETYQYLPHSIAPPPIDSSDSTSLSPVLDPFIGLPVPSSSSKKAPSILPSNLRRMHRTNHTTGLGSTPATAGLTILRSLICRPGNVVSIGIIPPGMPIHNISLSPGGKMMLCRAAGTSAEIVGHAAPDEMNVKYSLIRLQSGEVRKVMSEGCATIGQVSNKYHGERNLGKAGRSRNLGRRPRVRGVAMNTRDHPHGGGRGKSKGNVHPKSIWGWLTRGVRTRKPGPNGHKNGNKMVVRDRPRGKAHPAEMVKRAHRKKVVE